MTHAHRNDGLLDVAIIGGGVVGSFLAYYLAKSGRSVQVVDPHPGNGASSHNAGILALSYAIPMSNPKVLVSGAKSLLGAHRDFDISRPIGLATFGWLAKFAVASRPGRALRDARRISELADRSMELYGQFSTDQGIDLGLRKSGWLYVARSEKGLASQLDAARQLQSLGIRHRVLTQAELRDAAPEVAAHHIGGVDFIDDASMDPAAVTRSVITAAKAHGARYIAEKVSRVHREPAKPITVVTTSGRAIATKVVIIAAGSDSCEVAKLFGCRAAVERGFGASITVPTRTKLASRALMSIEDHVVVNPGTDSLRVTGGMQFGGGLASIPTSAQIADLWQAARRLLPHLPPLDGTEATWRGARPMTPDGLPRIAQLADNVYINAGHGTLGMTLAPASAEHTVRDLDIKGELG